MKQSKIVLSANGSQDLYQAGDYISIKAGAEVLVEIDEIGGHLVMQPGQSAHLAPFTRVRFTDLNGNGQTLVVVVGVGDLRDNRGVMETAPDYSRTNNDLAFQSGIEAPALAANYNFVQLWNPADSGVNLVLSGIYLKCAAVSYLFLNIDDAMAQTTVTFQQSWGIPSLKATPSGAQTSANGLLQLFKNTAGPAGADRYNSTSDSNGNYVAGFDGYIQLPNPVILPPATGATFVPTVANTALGCLFSFFEERV